MIIKSVLPLAAAIVAGYMAGRAVGLWWSGRASDFMRYYPWGTMILGFSLVVDAWLVPAAELAPFLYLVFLAYCRWKLKPAADAEKAAKAAQELKRTVDLANWDDDQRYFLMLLEEKRKERESDGT